MSCQGFDDVDCVQPSFYELGPVRYGLIRGTKAPSVAAVGVDMKFGGNFGVFESEKIDGGGFDVHGIVFGLNDEGWRSFFSGMDFGVGRHVLFGDGEIAGINDDGEIGPATDAVSGVDGIVEALIVVRAERGGEMSSGGEAEDTNAMRIDVPLGGARADEANSALCVLESGGRFRIWAGVGNAIFEDDAGDAARGEPVADFGALEIDCENVVPAAGENDDRGAGGFCGGVGRA